MVTRSVITVDLDTQEFDRFKQAFDAFSEQVSRTRAEAKTIGASFGGGAVGLTHAWRDVAGSTKSIASHIASATASLLKWTGIIGIGGGLLGYGGLLGLDKLANTAGNQRRLALGLGIAPGAAQNFGAAYGRIVDPNQLLGGVNSALTDVSRRVGLYGAGLSESDIRGKDAAQVANELLPALKRLADQTPTQMLQQVLTARHLDQFLGLQDFERLKNTPAAEIAGYQAQYQAHRRDIELTQRQARAWQDLQTQLHFAGLSIEATFIRGLAPLAPQLAKLSQGFSDVVKAFLKSPEVKHWIDETASGLETFAGYIGKPEFKTDVESFVHGVGQMADSIKNWLKYFGILTPDKDTSGKPGTAPVPFGKFNPFGVGPGGLDQPQPGDENFWKLWRKWQDDLYRSLTSPFRGGSGGSTAPNGVPRTGPLFGPQMMPGGFQPSAYRPGLAALGEAHDYFRRVGWDEPQTAGILANLKAESGFNPWARNASGHQGIAQWDANRAAMFQRLTGHSLAQSTYEEQLQFVQWELTHSEKAAGDQLRAYGRTPEAAADIVNRGYERSGVRSGARAGAASQYQQQFRDRSVQVTISNQTGGNANVSVAQLATT